MEKETKIKVLIVEPMKKPRVAEIENTLATEQKIVEGYIEACYPFDDEIAIICNEEGKLKGLPLNRAIYSENGELIEIIAGTFIIASAPIESENFESLSEEQIKKYQEMFLVPESFFISKGGITVVRQYD